MTSMFGADRGTIYFLDDADFDMGACVVNVEQVHAVGQWRDSALSLARAEVRARINTSSATLAMAI
jgi:hypothetical protein